MKIRNTLSNQWTFRILVSLAFAIVIFNLVFIASTLLGTNIAGMFLTSSTSTETKSGTMLSYGVTFDSNGYEKLLEYYKTITLTPEEKERFVRIGMSGATGCGPCCGVQNNPGIDKNGDPICGCGHNLALVGLMKHLVKNYGDKYTDEQIFNEVVKWKKLFFPGQVADDGSVIK